MFKLYPLEDTKSIRLAMELIAEHNEPDYILVRFEDFNSKQICCGKVYSIVSTYNYRNKQSVQFSSKVCKDCICIFPTNKPLVKELTYSNTRQVTINKLMNIDTPFNSLPADYEKLSVLILNCLQTRH